MSRFKAFVIACSLAIPCLSAFSSAEKHGSPPISKQDEFALARTVLRDAGKIGVRIKERQYRGFILEPVAVSQAEVDDFTGALETAAKIPDGKRAALVLADIALIQTTRGHKQQGARTFQQAHARAAVLKDREDQALVLGKIAELEAKSQNANATETFAQAIQIATGLSVDRKPFVLSFLGSYQFSAGQPEAVETLTEARRALSLISDTDDRWATALLLAPLQVRVGDNQGALITARLCADEADRHLQSYVLRGVAAEQAKKGMISEALRTSSEIANEMRREEALGAIVEAYLKNENLQEASRLTETIQHALVTKILSLIHIAASHATAGDADDAEKSLTQALDLFRKGVVEQPHEFQFGQIDVVRTLIETGQLQKATNSAQIIQFPPAKVRALLIVADAWAKTGDRLIVERLLTQAIKEAGSTRDHLGGVAQIYAQIGDIPTARKIARQIPHELGRSYAYQEIAGIQTQRGEAKSVMNWAADLRSPDLKSWVLIGIAFGILHKYGIDVAISA